MTTTTTPYTDLPYTPGELDDLAHDTVECLRTGQFTAEHVDRITTALADHHARHHPDAHLDRTGTVNRWHETEPFGFVTEDDPERTPWFLPRTAIPTGAGMLRKGTRVEFAGNPQARDGRRYPEIRAARRIDTRRPT